MADPPSQYAINSHGALLAHVKPQILINDPKLLALPYRLHPNASLYCLLKASDLSSGRQHLLLDKQPNDPEKFHEQHQHQHLVPYRQIRCKADLDDPYFQLDEHAKPVYRGEKDGVEERLSLILKCWDNFDCGWGDGYGV